MENKILEFIKKYKEYKLNKDDGVIISFNLTVTTRYDYKLMYAPPEKMWVLTLDDKDIKYFIDKYSKQLKSELNKKIEKLEEEYSLGEDD